MATIKANYDAMQQTSNDLSDESKRIFRLALDIERIMSKIPMKCTSQSLAKLKMARQCIGITAVSAKLMKFAVTLEQIKNSYKDADHRVLVGGDIEAYAKYLADNANGELSEDDVRRIKKAMDELDETKIHSGMTDDEKEKIKLYNSMFEKAYPKEAERINRLAEEYKNNHFSENEDLAKYFLYKDSFSSDRYDDANIKTIFSYSNNISSGMYIKYMEGLSAQQYIGTADSVDTMSDLLSVGNRKHFSQGSTAIYDVESHRNDDGSVDFTFSLANSTKRYTEITVYNANGEAVARGYMRGQKDPSSIPEVFNEALNMNKDLFEFKMFSVDSNSFNSKERFKTTIPAGGYIQITDDPNDMNYNSYSQIKYAGNTATDIGLAADTVKFNTSNPIINAGLDIGKGAASRAVGDKIQNSSSSVGDYAGDAAWSITEAIVTAGEANPAAAGMNIINGLLKINTAGEEFLVDYQQNKSKGNKSLFIYT